MIMNKQKGLVIAGFPGVGKTFAHQNMPLKTVDSDSSRFSKTENGSKHPFFPKNYIEHIKDMIEVADIVFVSTHKIVREALIADGISFCVVYPEIASRGVYMKRYAQRGSGQDFIDLVNNNWSNWIGEIENDERFGRVMLTGNTTLMDLMTNPDGIKLMKGSIS